MQKGNHEMFAKKYPYLTIILSLTAFATGMWLAIHNIAYFNGLNFLGILLATLGVLGTLTAEPHIGENQ